MSKVFCRLGKNWSPGAGVLRQHHFFAGSRDPFKTQMKKIINAPPCAILSQLVLPLSCRYQHSSSNKANIFDINNDLAANHKRQAKASDKLRDILNGIGMSISQWKIEDSKNAADNNQYMSNTITKSGNKNNMRGDFASGSRYLYKYPRRMPEEFDVYNGGNSARRRKKNWGRGDHADISARLRVKSIHAASQINITKVLTTVFGHTSTTPAIRHMFRKTSIIVQLPSTIELDDSEETGKDPAIAKSATSNKTISPTNASSDVIADEFFHSKQSQPLPRFVAVFRFGSVVFFNVSPKDAGSILEAIKSHSTDPIPKPFERRERFEIAISPHMQETAHVNADFATVKELNINNVAIISTIMGQTVAFDSYNDMVDELLATFASINSNVKRTGNFTAMEKDTLFKVVAQNNSLFIDIIAKLGIKDRSDTAWNMSQYERLHDGMRDEFEIENRFDQIEFKLNLIQQNAKFFLEILHNQKSDLLEWIIIVLIGFECVLMIMEMSGLGHKLLPQFGN